MYTVYAVQTFQRSQRLHPNGIIDDVTARRLGMYSGPFGTVRLGMTGWQVQAVQQSLINRGIFVRGGATGRFDVWTCYAVRTFQRLHGLPVTGVVDNATALGLGRITVPDSSAIWTALSQGSSGVNVARAQRALLDRGIVVRGGATGRFDAWTLYAVNTFQRYNGLRVTGVVDVETARALGLFQLTNPVATWKVLRVGNTGEQVRNAERALVAAGVRVVDGVDGIFKIGDYWAVQTFQRYNGLRVTGVIDMATADRLGMFGGSVTSATVLMATAAPTTAAATTAPTTSTTSTIPTTTTTSTSTASTTVVPATSVNPDGADVTVRGVVWIDANADGIHQPAEAPVPDIALRLLDADGALIDTDATGADGIFEFAVGSEATYSLEVIVPGGGSVAPTDVVPLGVQPEVADDFDSDFTLVADDVGLARTTPFAVNLDPVADIGLGLVQGTSDTTTLPSTTGVPTTVDTTTTTTLPASTTTVPAATTTTAPAEPTTPAPAPTTAPPSSAPETSAP